MAKGHKKALARDDGLCRICKSHHVAIHHIVFRSHCGNDDERNLICLCPKHHDMAHADEKVWREKLLDMQKEIYGQIDIEELKK